MHQATGTGSKLISLMCGAFILAGAGGFWWHQRGRAEFESQDTARLTEARALLRSGDIRQVLSLVPSAFRASALSEERAKDWQDVELVAAEKARDVDRLVRIYERDAESLLRHEEASILVARMALHTNDHSEYDRILKSWAGRETQPESWFVLEADALLLKQQTTRALAFLKTRSFPGARDAGRLTRLAMLTADHNVVDALGYLDQARTVAPSQPDVHFFLGGFYEKLGRDVPARLEYEAALGVAPGNVFFADQLGEYYSRKNEIVLAVDAWNGVLDQPAAGSLWLKAFFWSRALRPGTFDSGDHRIPAGMAFEGLVRKLTQLPPEVFWKEELKDSTSGSQAEATVQAIYWLQLLESLRQRDVEQAASLLAANPSRGRSWKPGLERALIRILNNRKSRSLLVPGETQDNLPPQTETHEIFRTIEAAARAEREAYPKKVQHTDLDQLLDDDQVFSWLMLAAGWHEAGLRMGSYEGALPAKTPPWVLPLVHEALSKNRGPEVARAFMEKQPPTDAVRAFAALSGNGPAAPAGAPADTAVDCGALEGRLSCLRTACAQSDWKSVRAIMKGLFKGADAKKASEGLRSIEEEFGGVK